ncbi:restriction endonuclease subunit S, partial [Kamptonema sp. PCC 6506]|uniref:restriction endonuclease subunit S n=2 Tax=Kamptonema TaxID=1501433 RepID=UPI000697419B
VTGRELGNKRVYWVHPNAFVVNIVFAWEQAVALTSSDENGFIASHRFLMFLPKQNRASLKFVILFFLRERGKYLLELASPGGAGRNKTLGQQNFAGLEITLPKIAEQEKIASFLGAVDRRLAQLRRKQELLQTYKRGVMHKIFSLEIRFKGAIGSEFPDWEEKRLDELGEFKNGFNADKSSFGDGVEFVNLMDIFGKSEIKKIPLERVQISSKQVEQYKIKKGDVLFVRSSVKREGVGQPCLVNDDFEDTVYSGFIIRFREKSSELCHLYKKYCFSSLEFRKELLSLATSSANTNINQESLSAIILFYPCKKEQEKITGFLTAMDRKIETLSRQIDQTEQFKKGLLQKMFV